MNARGATRLIALTLGIVVAMGAQHVSAGPISTVGVFDVCSLLTSGEASSLVGDPQVVKRGGVPGFLCAWNSGPKGKRATNSIAIMLFTESKIREISSKALSGDPAMAQAFRSGSPLSVFQALRNKGSSCLSYSGALPCAEIQERIALYKHTNAYDYVVLVFAQREEMDEGRDLPIERLVLDAAHVASRITPRLP